jgi:hypothetical protein
VVAKFCIILATKSLDPAPRLWHSLSLQPIKLDGCELPSEEVDVRKLLALALVLVTASLGVPAGIFAQSPATRQLGAISGELVDAGGRALVNQRVELARAGEIVQTTTTGSRGEWSFANVTPGDYVVRALVNGQVAGIRVLLTSGQTVANALIVAPSAAAPSAAFLAGLGALGATLVVAVIAAVIITTVVKVTGS